MIAIMHSEWQRIWARKKTKVLLFGYLALLLLECWFLYGMGGRAFYDAEHMVYLNSLNTAPFLFRELSLFLIFIFIPLLTIDSFNGEYRSGALRMVLIRPLARWRILTAKWMMQGMVLVTLTAVTMLTGVLFGMLVMPGVDTTTFYKTEAFGFGGAVGYILQYYLLALLILLVVSSISQLISLLMPNGVFSYLGVIVFLVGGLYVSSQMEFLLTASDSIFKQLAPQPEVHFIGLSFGFVIISLTLSFLIWSRRDFRG